MGTTGLIFGVVVAAWLAYLVPWYLSHRDQTPLDDREQPDLVGQASRVLKSGELSLGNDEADLDVSTPLIRVARRREVSQLARRAAVRRRRVLLAVVLGVLVLTGTSIAHITAWWAPLGGLGALAGGVLVSRLSVMRLHRTLDQRLADIELGDEEATILIAIEMPASSPVTADDLEHSVEISTPIPGIRLWDPIPVAAASYVQRPLAARTVRTIDLSAPVATPQRTVVTADDDVIPSLDEKRRAVGE